MFQSSLPDENLKISTIKYCTSYEQTQSKYFGLYLKHLYFVTKEKEMISSEIHTNV